MAKKYPIAGALGADGSFAVKVGHAPWDLYALVDRLRHRITPRRGPGRPTDRDWAIRRLVGFRKATWRKLRKLSDASARKGGRKLSPAQLAAYLIEETLRRSHTG